MEDLQWARQSVQEDLSLRSGSIRNELEGVLRELSYCKERKGSKLMSTVRRRFILITYTLLLLCPVWLLFGTSMYFVGPKKSRIENVQAAIDAYEVAKEMLLLGETLTQEWIQTHRNMVQPIDRNQTVFIRSNEVIKGLQYLSHCLAYNRFPVSNEAEMLKYLTIFRQDDRKTLSQVVAFYGELVLQPFTCSTDLLRKLEVQDNWTYHVGYQHMISAVLQLSQLAGRLPIDCDNDEFNADEALRLADTALANIYMARYFAGEGMWWTHKDSLLFHISDNDSSLQFCKEIKTYCSQILRRTHEVAVLQAQNTLSELTTQHRSHHIELIVFILVAILCFLAGTLPLPWWMITFSNDIQMHIQAIREVAARTVDENNRSNSVLCKIVPVRYAPFIGEKKDSVGTHIYECVSVLSLSVPSLRTLSDACTPGQLISIMTSILKLVEQRISLYNVHIIQKASFTYTVAAGMDIPSSARHVTDIANMALDLLNSCSDLEIGIVPDSRVQLQIGICTGPAIGTVPDQRPVRYCLVGRTVQMAAKLEKTSQLNAIHLSESTAELLDPQGFYRLAKTGHIITQDGYTCESYWLLGRRVSGHSLARSNKRESMFSTQSVYNHVQMVINPVYRYDSKENMYVPRTSQINCFIDRSTSGLTTRWPQRNVSHKKRTSMPDIDISHPATYRRRLTAAGAAAGAAGAAGAAAGDLGNQNQACPEAVPSTSRSSDNSDRNSQI